MGAIAMRIRARRARPAAQQMLDLIRRQGSGGAAFLPGVPLASGAHWLSVASSSPTPGFLGLDGVTRPTMPWLAAYVESTASTPAAVDGPVGFLSDGEGTVSGVNIVANPGPFTTTVSWASNGGAAIAATGGELVVTNTANGGSEQAQQDVFASVQPNTTYQITVSGRRGTASNFQFGVETSGQSLFFSAGYTNTSAQSYTGYFTMPAGQTICMVKLRANGVGTAMFGSVSIRAVTGRHATQGTGANKPTMRRGLVNLLTYSNDLTQTGWALQNSATCTSGTVTFSSGSPLSAIEKNVAIPGGSANQTLTVFAKVSCAAGTVGFRLKNTQATVLDNFSGEFVATTTPQIFTFTVTNGSSAGNGFQVFGLENSATSPNSGTLIVSGCGLAVGTLTAAQILAAGGIPLTTTIAASGAGGNYALEFGGSVTQLAGSFAPTTAATIIAAVRPNSLSGSPVLVGQPAGGAYLSINSSGGVTAGIDGGQTFSTANGLIVAGRVYVITVRIAVNGTSSIRINGVTVATSTAITTAMNQTTVSYGSNGSGAFLAGLMGPVLEFASVLSDAETLVLERGAGALAPITGVKF